MCHVETIFDLSNSRAPDLFLPWKYEHVTRWEQQKRRRKGEQRVAAIQAGERSRAGTTVASTMELRAATSPEGRGIVQRNGERRDDGNGEQQDKEEGTERAGAQCALRGEKLGGWRKGGWVKNRLGGVYLAIEGSDKPRRQYELSIVGELRSLGWRTVFEGSQSDERGGTSRRAEDKQKEYEGQANVAKVQAKSKPTTGLSPSPID